MTTSTQPRATPTATASATRSGRLAGKITLITGGNSGIGLATADAFVDAGATVIIAGRDETTLHAAAARLGNRVLAHRADVSRLADIDALMKEIRERFGRIDALFVNAGVVNFVAVDDATEEHFDHIFDINVKGAYFTVQKALPLLVPGASVILNGSIAGSIGRPNQSVYSASKAAIRSMARSLSADLVGRGIRVNVISPGPVLTPIFSRAGLTADENRAFTEQVESKVPLRRFGEPREIADVAVFLASSESSFMVGAEVVVDGGLSQL
jgi:NAD(P)-dependent dehydrogenase (short-subunit alcohol dehydrogenase family)